MADFTIDIDGLRRLRKNLDLTVESIEAGTKKLTETCAGGLGPQDLDRAADDFQSDWKDGLYKINKSLDGIREGLDEAVALYSAIEEAVADTLEQVTVAFESGSSCR